MFYSYPAWRYDITVITIMNPGRPGPPYRPVPARLRKRENGFDFRPYPPGVMRPTGTYTTTDKTLS